MSTFVAIVLGTPAAASSSPLEADGLAASASVTDRHRGRRLRSPACGITRVPPSGATQPFRLNPFAEVADGTRHLLHDRPLWLAVLGISYFWFVGVLLK